MKLSVSNIAWPAENDDIVYAKMRSLGYTALEIAPTRFINTKEPYSPAMVRCAAGKADRLCDEYGLSICSMQSILYGVNYRVFGDEAERQILLDYLEKACTYANAIKCRNIVFGCPQNRIIPDVNDYPRGVDFFQKSAKIAERYNVVLSIEPNPEIYGTNYITCTTEAFKLVSEVKNKAFGINLDFGTVISNGESLEKLADNMPQINHVHISEPYLVAVRRRIEHEKFAEILIKANYNNYVSVEMGLCKDIGTVLEVLSYISDLFS